MTTINRIFKQLPSSRHQMLGMQLYPLRCCVLTFNTIIHAMKNQRLPYLPTLNIYTYLPQEKIFCHFSTKVHHIPNTRLLPKYILYCIRKSTSVSKHEHWLKNTDCFYAARCQGDSYREILLDTQCTTKYSIRKSKSRCENKCVLLYHAREQLFELSKCYTLKPPRYVMNPMVYLKSRFLTASNWKNRFVVHNIFVGLTLHLHFLCSVLNSRRLHWSALVKSTKQYDVKTLPLNYRTHIFTL